MVILLASDTCHKSSAIASEHILINIVWDIDQKLFRRGAAGDIFTSVRNKQLSTGGNGAMDIGHGFLSLWWLSG